ncbi:hypothetical protein IAT38_007144 [Cryptococcus sp. DSM 104549]
MSTTPRPDLIDQLKALGISERSARFALSKTKNDVHKAADYVHGGRERYDSVCSACGANVCSVVVGVPLHCADAASLVSSLSGIQHPPKDLATVDSRALFAPRSFILS